MKNGFDIEESNKSGILSRYVQDKILNQVSHILARIQGGITSKALERILKIAEKLDGEGNYVREISGLRKAIENDHPFLRIFDRLKEVSISCREKLFRNFFIHAVFSGYKIRTDFFAKHPISRPFFFVISPTMRCNLRCIGCYAADYPKKDQLNRDVIDHILADARTMGIYFITISGGEPFCWENILDLFGTHNDLYFQVFTNGTLIDSTLARELSQLGNVAPVISCEGFEQETDYRRGRGTFARIVEAMEHLREAGVIFGFSSVPAAYNYTTLLNENYYDFLVAKGVLFGWLFQYIPIGALPDPGLMLTPEQRLELYEKINTIRKTRPIFVADFWNDGLYVEGCLAAGRTNSGYFHINSKGDIEPCVFVHFAADNIYRIYEKGGHLWDALDSEFFRTIRTGQPWNGNHRMPCMIIDNPHCLREVVSKTHPYPTHEDAEILIKDRNFVDHLHNYSKKLESLLQERGLNDPSMHAV
jgi:MoaA/NifB/PqqE/SkfB family radical SAM enzyme